MADNPIDEMNEKHVLVMINGQARVFTWQQDPTDAANPNALRPTFSPPSQMSQYYANRFVRIEYETANGTQIREEPLFKVWMRSSSRPTAVDTILDPDAGRFSGEALNLWRGFDVNPQEGEWALIREHIVDVICAGNSEHAEYLLNWVAWKLQNPTKMPEVAVCLIGRKGGGKGTFVSLLMKIFGHHSLQISERAQLVGKFNAHFLNCLLLNADEALWPGKEQDDGPLKRIITEPTLAVEQKGIDVYRAPNLLALVLTGNSEWMVPASEDERRYFVVRVSDSHLQDHAYFKALREEINKGGAEAFLHAMLNRPLGQWHPREGVPETEALQSQKMESADPRVLWLGGILNEGRLPESVRDESGLARNIVHKLYPNLARSQLLFKQARASDPRLRYLTEPAFYKFLTQYGVETAEDVRTKEGRFRRFPTLSAIRETFLKKHAWWGMFDDGQTQWEMPDGVMHFGNGENLSPDWDEMHEEAAE